MEKASQIAPNEAGTFSSTHQDLADVLGRPEFDSENFQFSVFGFQISGFPDFQIQGCQLACLVANWPEDSSGTKNIDFQTPVPE